MCVCAACVWECVCVCVCVSVREYAMSVCVGRGEYVSVCVCVSQARTRKLDSFEQLKQSRAVRYSHQRRERPSLWPPTEQSRLKKITTQVHGNYVTLWLARQLCREVETCREATQPPRYNPITLHVQFESKKILPYFYP